MVFLMAAATGCGKQRNVNLDAEKAAIRMTDANWLAAATAHDLERGLLFWADNATVRPPGTPTISGKEAIRNYVSEAFATPGFSSTWNTEKIEGSQSGDWAYSTRP